MTDTKAKVKYFATREARDKYALREYIKVAREYGEGRACPEGAKVFDYEWRFGLAGGMLTLRTLNFTERDRGGELFVRFEKRSKVRGEKEFPYSVTPRELWEWIESFSRKKAKKSATDHAHSTAHRRRAKRVK